MSDQGASYKPLILLIEPDEAVALTISVALEDIGAEIRRVTTDAKAREVLKHVKPDLTILELVLPDADGLEVLIRLVSRLKVPVLVCSTADGLRERVLSLRLGAEDFVAKPFDIDELAARAEAVLRRMARQRRLNSGTPPASTRQQVEDLVLDRLTCRVTLGGREVNLTPTQYRILAVFMSRPNQVLSREDLARAVGDPVHVHSSRALDMQVRRLRARLARYQGHAPFIVSVRGVGYRMITGHSNASSAA